MKYYLIVLVVSLHLLSYSQPRFGLEGGFNFCNGIVSTNGATSAEANMGFSIGGFSQLRISKLFFIQPEVIFSKKEALVPQADPNSTSFQHADLGVLDIPFYIGVDFKLWKIKAFTQAGPYLSYVFVGSYNVDGCPSVAIGEGENMDMKGLDYGAILKFGIEFGSKLQFSYAYGYGFANLSNSPNLLHKMNTQWLTISYLFGKT